MAQEATGSSMLQYQGRENVVSGPSEVNTEAAILSELHQPLDRLGKRTCRALSKHFSNFSVLSYTG